LVSPLNLPVTEIFLAKPTPDPIEASERVVMEIRWLASVAASCFHAAGEMLRGHLLVDTALAEKLSKPVDEFQAAAEAWNVDPIVLIDHLTAVSIEPIGLEHQVSLAIRKAAGAGHVARMAAMVTGWMQQMQSLFVEVHHNALEQLELRSTPLREQWEARGPGLIARLRSIVGPESIVESADAILVQPVMGGGGVAHVPYNRVSFEAVLANPVGDLPEVVRLGWLLAQLQLDLPTIQGYLSRQRVLEVGALALVPGTLAAAHDVELTGPVESVLPRALDAWRLPSTDSDSLLAWWETYLADRPAWNLALAALDRLVSAEAN
jgi:hypothetical protein